jgi:hypothetical protein
MAANAAVDAARTQLAAANRIATRQYNAFRLQADRLAAIADAANATMQEKERRLQAALAANAALNGEMARLQAEVDRGQQELAAMRAQAAGELALVRTEVDDAKAENIRLSNLLQNAREQHDAYMRQVEARREALRDTTRDAQRRVAAAEEAMRRAQQAVEDMRRIAQSAAMRATDQLQDIRAAHATQAAQAQQALQAAQIGADAARRELTEAQRAAEANEAALRNEIERMKRDAIELQRHAKEAQALQQAAEAKAATLNASAVRRITTAEENISRLLKRRKDAGNKLSDVQSQIEQERARAAEATARYDAASTELASTRERLAAFEASAQATLTALTQEIKEKDVLLQTSKVELEEARHAAAAERAAHERAVAEQRAAHERAVAEERAARERAAAEERAARERAAAEERAARERAAAEERVNVQQLQNLQREAQVRMRELEELRNVQENAIKTIRARMAVLYPKRELADGGNLPAHIDLVLAQLVAEAEVRRNAQAELQAGLASAERAAETARELLRAAAGNERELTSRIRDLDQQNQQLSVIVRRNMEQLIPICNMLGVNPLDENALTTCQRIVETRLADAKNAEAYGESVRELSQQQQAQNQVLHTRIQELTAANATLVAESSRLRANIADLESQIRTQDARQIRARVDNARTQVNAINISSVVAENRRELEALRDAIAANRDDFDRKMAVLRSTLVDIARAHAHITGHTEIKDEGETLSMLGTTGTQTGTPSIHVTHNLIDTSQIDSVNAHAQRILADVTTVAERVNTLTQQIEQSKRRSMLLANESPDRLRRQLADFTARNAECEEKLRASRETISRLESQSSLVDAERDRLTKLKAEIDSKASEYAAYRDTFIRNAREKEEMHATHVRELQRAESQLRECQASREDLDTTRAKERNALREQNEAKIAQIRSEYEAKLAGCNNSEQAVADAGVDGRKYRSALYNAIEQLTGNSIRGNSPGELIAAAQNATTAKLQSIEQERASMAETHRRFADIIEKFTVWHANSFARVIRHVGDGGKDTVRIADAKFQAILENAHTIQAVRGAGATGVTGGNANTDTPVYIGIVLCFVICIIILLLIYTARYVYRCCTGYQPGYQPEYRREICDGGV